MMLRGKYTFILLLVLRIVWKSQAYFAPGILLNTSPCLAPGSLVATFVRDMLLSPLKRDEKTVPKSIELGIKFKLI